MNSKIQIITKLPKGQEHIYDDCVKAVEFGKKRKESKETKQEKSKN